MRAWVLVIAGLIGVGALGNYFAKHDPMNPYLSLPPDKILEQGRALATKWSESNTPGHKSFIVVTKQEDEQARSALRAIKPDMPQFAEAQRLLGSLQREEDIGKKAMQAAIAKRLEDDVDGRKAFARRVENEFLKSGMDVTLTTSGPKATTLNFRYVLVSRPFLYKLANESAFLANCKSAGFARVHFTDGYSASANYDLKNDKFE